jgi:hypothetical protein
MGISIEMHKFRWNDLFEKIMKEGIKDTPKNRKQLKKILESFGEHLGGWYIILGNEYYEGYNSYIELSILLDNFFNLKDTFGVLLEDYGEHECRSNNNAYDVAENLGLLVKWRDD